MNAGMHLAKGYAAIIGVILMLVGIFGFVSNPIVGDAAGNPIFITGTVHNLIHLISGALALYVALGLRGEQQVFGVIGVGALYLAVFVLTLVSPDLFGILSYPVNAADQILHVALAVSALGVGWYERSSMAGGSLVSARR